MSFTASLSTSADIYRHCAVLCSSSVCSFAFSSVQSTSSRVLTTVCKLTTTNIIRYEDNYWQKKLPCTSSNNTPTSAPYYRTVLHVTDFLHTCHALHSTTWVYQVDHKKRAKFSALEKTHVVNLGRIALATG